MQRLLVIGSSGFLGACFARYASRRFTIVGACRSPDASCGELTVDVTRPDTVAAAVDRAQPDVVLHTAAIANIDRCEQDPELADRVNHLGAATVARTCRDAGARLLFTSTNAVFDGRHPPYAEDSPPTPPNVYGRSKAAAERAVLEILPEAVVVRLALVLGRSARPGTNSFVDRFESWLAAGEEVAMPHYEIRNPVDVFTLTSVLCELATKDAAAGVFHLGAADKLSRYDLARRLAVRLGYPAERIRALDQPDPNRAPRGVDDCLACDRLDRLRMTRRPTCDEVIDRCLRREPPGREP